MDAQDPPLSDLRYDHLQGRVETASARIYQLDRPADVAAAMAAPETFAPPADLPPKSKDGEEPGEKLVEMRYGPSGNTLSFRTVYVSVGGTEMTISMSPKGAGRRSLQCDGLLAYKDRPKHPFSCGQGELSYRSPGIWRMTFDSAAGTTVIERQVDAQGRETSVDQKSDGKKGPSGQKAENVSQQKVSLNYDEAGRAIAARETRNGQVRYRYTTYSQFDRHGNPQRAFVMSSTSTDPHDRASVVSIELRLYAYTYYDEIR